MYNARETVVEALGANLLSLRHPAVFCLLREMTRSACLFPSRLRPDLIDFDKLKKSNAHHNLQNAFNLAEQHLGLTKLLDPEGQPRHAAPLTMAIFNLSLLMITFSECVGRD